MADQMTVSPTEPLWDAKKTATFMAASPSWVYKSASSGVLPAVRVGGLLRFRPQAIIDFIASKTKGR